MKVCTKKLTSPDASWSNSSSAILSLSSSGSASSSDSSSSIRFKRLNLFF